MYFWNDIKESMVESIGPNNEDRQARKSSVELSSERRRSDARQRVAEKWARRMNQKSQQRRNDGHILQSQQQQLEQSQLVRGSTTPFPSVCFMLRSLWNDVLSQQSQRSRNKAQLQEHKISKSSLSSRDADGQGSRPSVRTSFPSVLSILQETAVRHQIESFDTARTSTTPGNQQDASVGIAGALNSHVVPDGDTSSEAMSSEPALPLLSVLPAHYDFSQAINNMSQSRSRAFLLLDLAAIVKTHVYWRKQLQLSTASLPSSSSSKVKKSTPFIQMVYNVQHNANLQLLQVLQRLNVACKVSTKYDLELLCSSSIDASMGSSKNETFPSSQSATTIRNRNTLILDDASCPAKPNSYYRKLVLDEKVTTLSIDGPNEVVRLCQALQTMAKRRHQACPSLSFVLRLERLRSRSMGAPDQTDIEVLHSKELLRRTKKAIDSFSDHELSGISLEMPYFNEFDDDIHTAKSTIPAIHNFCRSATELLEYMRNELHCPCQQLDLTTAAATTLPPGLIQWLKQIQPKKASSNSLSNAPDFPLVKQVTLDVSYLLVARAGALCTRIIGVKEQKHPNHPTGSCDTSGKTIDETPTTMVHYYIDDGCYGSLYSETKDVVHIPLPLKRRQEGDPKHDSSEHNTDKIASIHSEGSGDNSYAKATVWGPTCDGLDKVCHDILLPKLERDDW